MPDLTFNCPKCDSPIAAPEEGVGMEVVCPHCSELIIIPGGDPLPLLTPLAPSAPKPPPIPISNSGSEPKRRVFSIVGACAGAVLFKYGQAGYTNFLIGLNKPISAKDSVEDAALFVAMLAGLTAGLMCWGGWVLGEKFDKAIRRRR